MDVRPIIERIVQVDLLALVFNSETFLKNGERVVDLACGHKTVTRAINCAACPRCQEMLRRSIDVGNVDYDAFRNHGARDRMHWPRDPMRLFHEPTDMAGNFLDP